MFINNRKNSGMASTSFQNLKFIIKHIALINQCKNAMEWLNRTIELGEPLKANIDVYVAALNSANNLEYSFFLYSRQFPVKSVSLVKELLDHLVDTTSRLLESAKPIDLANIKSISEITQEIDSTLITLVVKKYVNSLASDFRATALSSANFYQAFEKLKSLLVLEDFYRMVVSGQSTDEVFDSVRQEFCQDVQQALKQTSPLPRLDCQS